MRAGVLVVAALMALAACERGAKEKAHAPEASPVENAEPSAVAPGEVRIDLRDGRVTVVCNAAPRGLVIERLAREAGFQTAGDLDAQPLTLQLDEIPLDQALPALLVGTSYRAQWNYDAERSRHVLAKLEVGEIPEATAAAHKPKIAEALRERIRAMRDRQPTEKQKAEAAARREEHARSQADALEELRSSSPEMRMEAVADIEPEGPALHSLIDSLATDADPRVRAKIADQLADADGCVASMGLVTATGDPDPDVRCSAWRALEMNCDESMLPTMQPQCAREQDSKVRECCTSTLEMCE